MVNLHYFAICKKKIPGELDMFHPCAQECCQDSCQLNWLSTVKHFCFTSTDGGDIQYYPFNTWVVCSSESIFVLVESVHDDLPIGVDVIKLCRLTNQLLTYVICQKDVLLKEKRKNVVADKWNKEKHRREDKTVWGLVGAITGMFTNTLTQEIQADSHCLLSSSAGRKQMCASELCYECVWDRLQWVCASHVESGPLCNLMDGIVTGVY